MIELSVEQGTPDWFMARLGIPTASCFDRILTPTGKPSAQQRDYMGRLLAERITGEPYETWDGTVWMARGTEMQDEAAGMYQIVRGVQGRLAGVCYLDERRHVACSPDLLVGEDGGAEIKCPNPATHIGYLLAQEVPKEHRVQVYGSLWVTGRDWWDFVSYHPQFPPLIVRAHLSDEWRDLFDTHVLQFADEVSAGMQRLRELGYTEAA